MTDILPALGPITSVIGLVETSVTPKNFYYYEYEKTFNYNGKTLIMFKNKKDGQLFYQDENLVILGMQKREAAQARKKLKLSTSTVAADTISRNTLPDLNKIKGLLKLCSTEQRNELFNFLAHL